MAHYFSTCMGGLQGKVFINRTLSGYHWQLELPVKACWGENPRNAIPSWSWFPRCQIASQRKHDKINAPKNDKHQKKAPWKQRWSIQSCPWGCLQLPGSLSQYSPPSFSPVKYESPGWSLEPLAQAALQERGAGCASLCLFSPKKGKSLPWLPESLCWRSIPAWRGLCASPQAVLVVSQSRLWCLSSSSNYGAQGSR